MQRRSFLAGLAAASAATAARPLLGAAAKSGAPKIALGYDNFAVRAMQWKAPALIDYAAQLKCDTLLISDLDAYESLDDAALRAVRAKAEAAGVQLYAGGWSICPTSKTFRPNRGTAQEHLRLGLRVAKALGSPVYRVILGSSEDRKTEGGIQARIRDTVAVLKAGQREIAAAGVRVAIENHAGDLHSWELRELIQAAGGLEFVGANIDSGNAAWTLEDPMDVLETLGPVTLCSSLRDDMVWETPDGAAVQWTAAGDGLIDWKKYAARWAQLCPKVPIMIETISGGPREFKFKQPEFWQHYDKRPDKLAKFEAMAKRGRKIPPAFTPPSDPKERTLATQNFQRADLEKSLTYLRQEIGLGRKA